MRLWHSRPVNRVEQKLEGAFGLGAMLDAKAEQDDLALAFGEGDGGGFAGELLCSLGLAGDENVFGVVGIPGEHGTLYIGGG